MMITRAKISAVRASGVRRSLTFFVPDAALIRVNTVYAHIVHTTAKQVISRRGKNENVCEMCQKLKNARAKRAKLLFFIVKYANLRRSLLVAVAVVVA